MTKLVSSLLQAYHRNYAKGGQILLEFIYKLREMEQYFISCRRLLNFGRCTDQLYSAYRSLQLYDPVYRTTTTTAKLALSFQMFADHMLWLHQMGFVNIENKQSWVEKANKFWLYATTVNLLRDTYELVCILQKRTTSREEDEKLVSKIDNKFTLRTPIEWARSNPKLSCDLIKNLSDFWIPYCAVNKLSLHPIILSTLGIVSTSMGIMQVYDSSYRLSSS